MKSVFAIVAIMGLVGSAFSLGCISTPEYSMELKLSCQGNELSFNWPNYKNIGQLYACQGVGRPLLLNCATGTYFSYVLQSCQDCANYIPSPPCGTLKISNSSSCQRIGGEPTPTYPTTVSTLAPTTTPTMGTATPTLAPTTTTTTTKKPTTTKPTTTKPTTTPTTTTAAFPPAPSPSTVDPNVPTPPTAAPTPPPVEAKPPTIVAPN